MTPCTAHGIRCQRHSVVAYKVHVKNNLGPGLVQVQREWLSHRLQAQTRSNNHIIVSKGQLISRYPYLWNIVNRNSKSHVRPKVSERGEGYLQQ